MSDTFTLCPNAPHGPRDCGMVAVQVDANGQRWVCTTYFSGHNATASEACGTLETEGTVCQKPFWTLAD
jgi:hypothetical protein